MARSIPIATSAGTAGQLTLTLPAAITGALLTRVPAAFHGGINDVLLTGLVLAVADWCRRRGRGAGHGSHAVLLDLEGHGREEVFAGRRSLAHGGLVHQPVPGAARSRGARSRRGPGGRTCAGARAQAGQGTAAGAAGPRPRLWAAALPQPRDRVAARAGFAAPQIGFNYLGRFGAAPRASAATGRRRPEAVPLARRRSGDAAGARARGQCADPRRAGGRASSAPPGRGRRRCCRRKEVRDLARALVRGAGGLVRHVEQPEAGGRTPSDLPLLALSQAEIERLERAYPRSRTSCRCRRCRRGCCSMRSMMRRRPTSTRCSWCSRCRGRSMRKRCKRPCRR